MADMIAWPVISFTYYKQHTLLSYIRFYFIWIHIQSHCEIIRFLIIKITKDQLKQSLISIQIMVHNVQ